jgi:hypothetical protein
VTERPQAKARRIQALPLYDVVSAYEVAQTNADDPALNGSPLHCESAAVLAYALGEPLSLVRDYGKRALLTYREILRRRPPLERFQKPISPGSWLDYSIAASSESLRYLYWALLLREAELAREIAEGTWDPPKMGKIRIYPEYRVAYGLRELVLGRKAEAISELEQLPASAKLYFQQQAAAISSLAREARAEAAAAIVELTDATRLAMRKEYLPQLKIFALPGAGLASYALDCGLMTQEQLPRGIDAFPLELVLPPG